MQSRHPKDKALEDLSTRWSDSSRRLSEQLNDAVHQAWRERPKPAKQPEQPEQPTTSQESWELVPPAADEEPGDQLLQEEGTCSEDEPPDDAVKLEMQMQLNELDIENQRLRKQCEQQDMLMKQMQEALLLGSQPAEAAATPAAATAAEIASDSSPGGPSSSALPSAEAAWPHLQPRLQPQPTATHPSHLQFQHHQHRQGVQQQLVHNQNQQGGQQQQQLQQQDSDGALAAVIAVEELERHQQQQQQQVQQQRQRQQQQQREKERAQKLEEERLRQWQELQRSIRNPPRVLDSSPSAWTCSACTYVHTGKEALYLRCAVCSALR